MAGPVRGTGAQDWCAGKCVAIRLSCHSDDKIQPANHEPRFGSNNVCTNHDDGAKPSGHWMFPVS